MKPVRTIAAMIINNFEKDIGIDQIKCVFYFVLLLLLHKSRHNTIRISRIRPALLVMLGQPLDFGLDFITTVG